MIRIDKGDPPSILLGKGKTQRGIHCDKYRQDPDAYRNGSRSFDFKASIYAHKDVKQNLIDTQNGKCCFCESVVRADGEVEHFRPKSSVKQGGGDSPQRPGYYWLAYEWNNLYLSCGPCNKFKGILFPLEKPAHRARDHEQDIEREQPLLVAPISEEPRAFVGFRSEVAFPVNDSQKGSTTIETVRLNRESLQERRLEKLQLLKKLYQITTKRDPRLAGLAKEAQQKLEQAARDSGEFAAAVRAAIATNFRYVLG